MQLVGVAKGNPSISLTHEIDLASAGTVVSALEPLVAAGGPVTVDLSNLTFMDSTGIHVLLDAAAALGDRGCIILHGAQGSVARVLEMTQFASLKPNIHLIDCDILAATG
jgi:anti-anti-sigma factor